MVSFFLTHRRKVKRSRERGKKERIEKANLKSKPAPYEVDGAAGSMVLRQLASAPSSSRPPALEAC